MKPPIAPIGLDYVGSALRAAAHEVRLLDLCWEDDAGPAIERAFAEDRPDLAALTFRNTDDCFFASRTSFIDVLQSDVARIRGAYDGPVVIGGGGFSLMPVELLEHTGAPYGVVGDGESALPALLRALSGEITFADVPGLVWRDVGAWRRNAPHPADLASLSLAARDVVDNERYFREGGQIGIETKRGCPGRCIYCADPVIKGHRPRPRPAGDLVAELRGLLDRGIDYFHLCDSEFNLPIDHALGFCRALIDSGLGERAKWYTYAAPAPFTRELIDLMQRAGCIGINFGVDSGSDAMLAALGRDYRAADVAETARICHDAGMVFMYDLLLGGPGETTQTLVETMRLMQSLPVDRVGVSLGVRVYPGTQLAAMLDKNEADALEPEYYVSPKLGAEPLDFLRELIGDDKRFLLPVGDDEQDYNYNDNTVLQNAIARGHRGAYWDILRKLQLGLPPR